MNVAEPTWRHAAGGPAAVVLRAGDTEWSYERLRDGAARLAGGLVAAGGGYNVYPREVEEVLYGHPDIAEVAVVGVPDEHFGEEVGAALVLRPGAAVEPEAIRRWAKERLSAYKVPRLFAFVEELPKGATGKVLKRKIALDSLQPNPQPSGGLR